MIDLGSKASDDQPEEANKNAVNYPSLYLSKDIGDFKVGDSFNAMVKMKVTSKSINQYEGKKKTTSLSLDVLEIDPKKAVDDSDDEEKYEDGGKPNVQRMIEDGLDKRKK